MSAQLPILIQKLFQMKIGGHGKIMRTSIPPLLSRRNDPHKTSVRKIWILNDTLKIILTKAHLAQLRSCEANPFPARPGLKHYSCCKLMDRIDNCKN
ncbi:MAG: hypothetical protein ED859_06655 [Desulfuromonadales bacterium]|nr:MAG: hypothetical protein ED859_06655 [Desulfuromonadales bacterium]